MKRTCTCAQGHEQRQERELSRKRNKNTVTVMCRDIRVIYDWALLWMYRALLRICGALLRICGAFLRICGALLRVMCFETSRRNFICKDLRLTYVGKCAGPWGISCVAVCCGVLQCVAECCSVNE